MRMRWRRSRGLRRSRLEAVELASRDVGRVLAEVLAHALRLGGDLSADDRGGHDLEDLVVLDPSVERQDVLDELEHRAVGVLPAVQAEASRGDGGGRAGMRAGYTPSPTAAQRGRRIRPMGF